jgi:hypothetical protein
MDGRLERGRRGVVNTTPSPWCTENGYTAAGFFTSQIRIFVVV